MYVSVSLVYLFLAGGVCVCVSTLTKILRWFFYLFDYAILPQCINNNYGPFIARDIIAQCQSKSTIAFESNVVIYSSSLDCKYVCNIGRIKYENNLLYVAKILSNPLETKNLPKMLVTTVGHMLFAIHFCCCMYLLSLNLGNCRNVEKRTKTIKMDNRQRRWYFCARSFDGHTHTYIHRQTSAHTYMKMENEK